MIDKNYRIPAYYNLAFNIGFGLFSLALIGIGGYLVNKAPTTLNIVFLCVSIFYACTAFMGLGLRHMLGRAGFPIWLTCLSLCIVFQAVILGLFAGRKYESHYKTNEMDRRGTYARTLSDFLRNNHKALLGVLGTGLGLMVLDAVAAVWMKVPALSGRDKAGPDGAYHYNNSGNPNDINHIHVEMPYANRSAGASAARAANRAGADGRAHMDHNLVVRHAPHDEVMI